MDSDTEKILEIVSFAVKKGYQRLKYPREGDTDEGRNHFGRELNAPIDERFIEEFYDFLKLSEKLNINHGIAREEKANRVYELIYILFKEERYEDVGDIIEYYKEITRNQTSHIPPEQKPRQYLAHPPKRQPETSTGPHHNSFFGQNYPPKFNPEEHTEQPQRNLERPPRRDQKGPSPLYAPNRHIEPPISSSEENGKTTKQHFEGHIHQHRLERSPPPLPQKRPQLRQTENTHSIQTDGYEPENFIPIKSSTYRATSNFTGRTRRQQTEMDIEREPFGSNLFNDGYDNDNESENEIQQQPQPSSPPPSGGDSSEDDKRAPVKKRRKLIRIRMSRKKKALYDSSSSDSDNDDYSVDNSLENERTFSKREKSLSPSPVQSDDESGYGPNKSRKSKLIKYTLKKKFEYTEGASINMKSMPIEKFIYPILEKLRREAKRNYERNKPLIVSMLKGRSLEEVMEESNRAFNRFKQELLRKKLLPHQVESILRESEEVRNKFSFTLFYEDMYDSTQKNPVKQSTLVNENDAFIENEDNEVIFRGCQIFDEKDNALEHFRLFESAMENGENVDFGPGTLRTRIDLGEDVEINDTQEQEVYTKVRYIIKKKENGEQIALSEDLSKLLMKHQKEGIKFIWEALAEKNSGAILADEMGMGKTLTALGFVETYIRYHSKVNVLILLPKSVIESWKDDIRKIKTSTYTYHCYKRYPRGAKPRLKNCCAYLLTYDMITKFKNIFDWPDILILDEGHLLKNESSQRRVSVSKFKTKKRLILSGSPIQNNLDEFIAMIKIADKKRSLQLEHDAAKINSGDIKVLDNYSDIISRRLIKDTIRDEIPSMHSVTLFLNLQKPQKKIFEQLNRELTKDSSKNVFLIQEFISWVLVHPRVILDLYESKEQSKKKELEEPNIFSKHYSNKKMELALKKSLLEKLVGWTKEIEDINDETLSAKIIAINKIVMLAASRGEKVTIFTRYIGSLDVVEKFLPKGINYIKLSGKTRERESAIKRFRSSPECTVLLLSIKAYGHGINLTCANHLIIVERDWNPTYEVQAAMRVYRKGQTRDTYIYRLVTSNTYDEKIYSVEVKKESISKTVLDQMKGKPVNLKEVGLWEIYDNKDDHNIEYTKPTNEVFKEIVRQLGGYLKGIAEHKDILGLGTV